MSDVQVAPTEAVLPVKLPKFTIILGGDHAQELADALAKEHGDRTCVELHFLGKNLCSAYLGRDEVEDTELVHPGLFVEQLARDMEQFLRDNLGDDYASTGFINNYDSGEHSDGDDYIFVDATIHDIDPLVRRFGKDEVVVIFTGPLSLIKLDDVPTKLVWLAMPSIEERMAQLRRELGTL